MMKRGIILTAAVAILLLAGCGNSSKPVYVESVAELTGVGTSYSDSFAGIVASDSVLEISKDVDKQIAEVFVKVGDGVEEGQKLFSYDTDDLELKIDRQKLELEQLDAQIENYKSQITELTRERESAPDSQKLEYTVQIQSAELDLKETEINRKSKAAAIASAEAGLADSVVTSPAAGTVKSIADTSSGDGGSAYIKIDRSGTYQICATITELQRGAVSEGDTVKITSRTNDSDTWSGVVTKVDYNSTDEGNQDGSYYGGAVYYGGSVDSASKYKFYVRPDTTDGLLIGQHVYVSLSDGDEGDGMNLPNAYICSENGEMYVWAENNGVLERRGIVVGEFDSDLGTYEIKSGLSAEDYIAYPGDNCRAGAPVTYDEPENETRLKRAAKNDEIEYDAENIIPEPAKIYDIDAAGE